MQSYYEINVSLNGRHFFATAPRSLITEAQALEAYQVFVELFTKAAGYRVSVTYWKSTGSTVDFDACMGEER